MKKVFWIPIGLGIITLIFLSAYFYSGDGLELNEIGESISIFDLGGGQEQIETPEIFRDSNVIIKQAQDCKTWYTNQNYWNITKKLYPNGTQISEYIIHNVQKHITCIPIQLFNITNGKETMEIDARKFGACNPDGTRLVCDTRKYGNADGIIRPSSEKSLIFGFDKDGFYESGTIEPVLKKPIKEAIKPKPVSVVAQI